MLELASRHITSYATLITIDAPPRLLSHLRYDAALSSLRFCCHFDVAIIRQRHYYF